MRPQSCKAKGRRLQQEVARKIIDLFKLPDSDVKSLPMGSQGEDVWLSEAARKLFPFSIECKAQEKINVRAAFEQAKENSKGHYPLLVHSKNRSETLATLRFDDLLELIVLVTRPVSRD